MSIYISASSTIVPVIAGATAKYRKFELAYILETARLATVSYDAATAPWFIFSSLVAFYF